MVNCAVYACGTSGKCRQYSSQTLSKCIIYISENADRQGNKWRDSNGCLAIIAQRTPVYMGCVRMGPWDSAPGPKKKCVRAKKCVIIGMVLESVVVWIVWSGTLEVISF